MKHINDNTNDSYKLYVVIKVGNLFVYNYYFQLLFNYFSKMFRVKHHTCIAVDFLKSNIYIFVNMLFKLFVPLAYILWCGERVTVSTM